MKRASLIISLGVLIMSNHNLFSQEDLCICFDEDTKNIEYNISQDSVRTSFSITKPGFETKKEKENAIEEYKKRGPIYPPRFYIGYVAGKFRVKHSLKEINCALVLSVDDFRKHNFEYPPDVGSHDVIFIKKNSDQSFFIWKAISLE